MSDDTKVVLDWDGLFIIALNKQQDKNFQISKDHGFIEDNNFGERIALIHSELSEALEAYRHNDPPSDHIPEFTGIEEELADAMIRILNTAKAYGKRVGEAMLAKQAHNAGRPYLHGKVI
jgi:NTP pyrophosphatase (non-canonical NTP hydrolase)